MSIFVGHKDAPVTSSSVSVTPAKPKPSKASLPVLLVSVMRIYHLEKDSEKSKVESY